MLGRSVCSVAKVQAGRRLSPAHVVSLLRCMSSKGPKAERPELKAPEIDSRLLSDADIRAENARLDALPSFAEMQAEVQEMLQSGTPELVSDVKQDEQELLEQAEEEKQQMAEIRLAPFSLADVELVAPELSGEAQRLQSQLHNASDDEVYATLQSLASKSASVAALGAALSPQQLTALVARIVAAFPDPTTTDGAAAFPDPDMPKAKIDLYKAEEAAYEDYVSRAQEVVNSYKEKGEPVDITQLALQVKYQPPQQPAFIKGSQAPADLPLLATLVSTLPEFHVNLLGHLSSAAPKQLYYLFAAVPADQRGALLSVVDWNQARAFVECLSPAQLTAVVESFDASPEGQVAYDANEAQEVDADDAEDGAQGAELLMKPSALREDHQLARLAVLLDAKRMMHLLRTVNDDAMQALLSLEQVQDKHHYIENLDWVATRPLRLVDFAQSRQVVHPSIPADPAPVYPTTLEKRALLAVQKVRKVQRALRHVDKSHDVLKLKIVRIEYYKSLANWDGNPDTKPKMPKGLEALFIRHPDQREESAGEECSDEDFADIVLGTERYKGVEENSPDPDEIIDNKKKRRQGDEAAVEEGEEEMFDEEAQELAMIKANGDLKVPKLGGVISAYGMSVNVGDVQTVLNEANPANPARMMASLDGDEGGKPYELEELEQAEASEQEDEAQRLQDYEDELQDVVDEAIIAEKLQAELAKMTPEQREKVLAASKSDDKLDELSDELLSDSALGAYGLMDRTDSEAEEDIGLDLGAISESDSEQDFDERIERYNKELAELNQERKRLSKLLDEAESKAEKAEHTLHRARMGDKEVLSQLTAEEAAYDAEVVAMRELESSYRIPLKPDRGANDEFVYRAPPGFEPFYLADETPVYEYPRSKVLTEAERQHLQSLKKQGLLKDDWMPSETESEVSDEEGQQLTEEKELSQYERQLLKEQWFKDRTPPSPMEHATFDRSWIPPVPGALPYDPSHLTDLARPYVHVDPRVGGMGPKDGDYGMIKYTLHCTHFYADFLDLEIARTLRTIRDHLASDIRCDPWHRSILDAIEFSLPVRVPVPKHKMTVIRGPFIDKQARNQYEIRWCKSLVSFKVPQFMYPQMIETFERTLQHAIQLSPGIKIHVTKSLKDRQFR